MNALYEKLAPRGLRMMGMSASPAPIEEIRKLVADNGVKFPQLLNWVDEESVWKSTIMPWFYIIGTDGKLKYSGFKAAEYDRVLEAELSKVKFPGLGDVKVAPELESAAKAYSAGDYAKAYKLAEEAAAKEGVKEEAAASAQAIKERVEARFKELRNRAETAEVENNWKLALSSWDAIAKRFSGYDDAADVAERLAKLKADKKVALEIEAFDGHRALDREIGTKKDVTLKDWIEGYTKFAEKYKDTAAGAKAAERVAEWQEQLKNEQSGKKESEK